MLDSLFAFLGIKGAKKLFEMDFSLEISEQFISCMDVQLTKLFEKITAINVKPPVRLGWQEKKDFDYNKGSVSKMNVRIYFGYGSVVPWILWKSKSGRIYEIADTDIDCNDIEFWFEELDVDACRNFWKPKWTLLRVESFKDTVIADFKRHSIDASYQFLKCADDQLTPLFNKLTGLKSSMHLCMLVPSTTVLSDFVDNQPVHIPNPILEIGAVTKLKMNLCIIAFVNSVMVIWKSKSGRIYKMSDTDIDCNDIAFSFEYLNIPLYIEQFYPKGQKLPFVLSILSLLLS